MNTDNSGKSDDYKTNANHSSARTMLVSAIGSMAGSFVIHQAKKLGFKIVGVDIFPKQHLVNSKLVSCFVQVPPSSHPDYEACLSSVLEQYQITHYLPITDFDIDFTLKNTELFHRHETAILVETKSDLGLFRDKYTMALKLAEAGINHIQTNEWRAGINAVTPPCVIKPRFGKSSEDTHKVFADASISVLKSGDADYIIQPFIDGTIVTCDIIKQGDKHYFIPRFEHLRTTNGAGTSVETFIDDKLDSIIDKFCSCFEFTGCINIEFIKRHSDYYLMDVNPRMSAGVEFSHTVGYDFVSNHIRCFLGEKLDDMSGYKQTHLARDSAITMLSD